MSTSSQNPANGLLPRVMDTALEASIVGSFTRIGFQARDRLTELGPVDADLTGQVAVVTGATSGIGRATAAALCQMGAEVHVTSRSEVRAQTAADVLNGQSFPGTAIGHALDTAERASVLGFAAALRALDNPVDMLLHNAGALTSKYNVTSDGTEVTLASHLIGPYLLTRELRPHLNQGARIIWMASGGMYTQGLDVKRIQMSQRSYKGAVAYARAKRGQVELVTHLAPQWAPDLMMHSMHPGWVDTPGVDAGIPGFGRVMGPLLRTPEQGADTMVWLAATGGGQAKPGQFWLDRQPRRTSYLPGTSATERQRQSLVDWLNAHPMVTGTS